MKLKRIATILIIILSGIILLAFIFISPIAKYAIEKNSEAWIGRKVKMENLWINLFTETIKVSGLKIFENKSDKIFFSCNGFYGKIAVHKLLSGKYDLKEIKFTKPEVTIIQKGNHFNYDDIIRHFSDTNSVKKKTNSPSAQFWVRNFSIDSASIHYTNTNPETNISLINFTVSCPLIAYDNPNYLFNTSFNIMSGGNVNGVADLNSASLNYALQLDLKQLNIAVLFPYLRDYIKIKSLDGLVSTSLAIKGNFNKPTEIASSGSINLEKFSLIDTTGETLTSVENFKVTIDSLNTKNNIYKFNTITFSEPYLKFALYEHGYNFDRILTSMATDSVTSNAPVESYSNIFQMMAGYVKEITEEYEVSNYKVEKFEVEKGHLIYTDYTLEDKFQYDLDSLHILSDHLDSKNERINIVVSSRLNKSGILNGSLSVNPDGFKDMEINYTIKKMLLSDINPYSKYYVATPFMDGIVEYDNNTTIKNNKLKSDNKLHVERIEVGSKVKNKTAYNLPIKLAVSLLKDVKGNINLSIPVEGDLADPKYKFGKVIWDVFKNIIIKAATAPFRLLSNAFGGKEEDYKEIQFQYLQKYLSDDQLHVLNNISKVLTEKSDLKTELIRVNNIQDETEHLAIFETKKQYLLIPDSDSLSETQLQSITNLSNKDSLFNIWLDQKLNTTPTLNSVQDRCIEFIGKEKLTEQINQLIEKRNTSLQNYFVQNNIKSERIKMSDSKDENEITKQTVPRYVINFFADDSPNSELKK